MRQYAESQLRDYGAVLHQQHGESLRLRTAAVGFERVVWRAGGVVQSRVTGE